MPIYDAKLEVCCDECQETYHIDMVVGYSDYSGGGSAYSVTLTVEDMERDGWEIEDDGETVTICPDCMAERSRNED